MTMKTRKEVLKQVIKNELLNQFRKMKAVEGDILSPVWLYEEFLPSLRKKGEAVLEEAIGEMLHDGIIANSNGRRPTYRLTAKGADLLNS
jgi:RIO-like serine/threonine protein kinase